MLPGPQEIHHQPGINWTQAARLAMGGSPRPGSPAGYDDCTPKTQFSQSPFDVLEADATIKYPPVIGKHLKRNPQRDSFLRGGEQFRSIKHNGVAHHRIVEQSLAARLYGSLKRTFSKKSGHKAIPIVQSQKCPRMSSKVLDADDASAVLENDQFSQHRGETGTYQYDDGESMPDYHRSRSVNDSFYYERSVPKSRGSPWFESDCLDPRDTAAHSEQRDQMNPWLLQARHDSSQSRPSFKENAIDSANGCSAEPLENTNSDLINDINGDYEKHRPGNRKVSRVDLHDFSDESAVLVQHPSTIQDNVLFEIQNRDQSVVPEGNAHRAGHHLQDDSLSQPFNTRRRIHEVLEQRRSRTSSAAQRETTLNDWSSDDSMHDDRGKVQGLAALDSSNIREFPTKPFVLEEKSSKEATRSALEELDQNELPHPNGGTSQDSMPGLIGSNHRAQSSTKAQKVRRVTPSSFVNLKGKWVYPRACRDAGKVKSCIQGFEDRIHENKIRGDNRKSSPSTSSRTCSATLSDQKILDKDAGVSQVVPDTFRLVRHADPSFGVHHDVRSGVQPRETI